MWLNVNTFGLINQRFKKIFLLNLLLVNLNKVKCIHLHFLKNSISFYLTPMSFSFRSRELLEMVLCLVSLLPNILILWGKFTLRLNMGNGNNFLS